MSSGKLDVGEADFETVECDRGSGLDSGSCKLLEKVLGS